MLKRGIALGFTNSGKWYKKIILKDLCVFNITVNESYLSALFKKSVANSQVVIQSIDCGLR